MDLSLDKCFIEKIKHILLSKNLISEVVIPILTPYHFISIHGETCSHYVLKCGEKTYFLKMVKDNDNTIFCLPYLQELENKYKTNSFPKVLCEIFSYNNANFYILDYVEGKTLDELDGTLSIKELHDIAHQIKDCINILSLSTSQFYSNRNNFYKENFGNLLIEKFMLRLNNDSLKKYVTDELISAVNKCKMLLLKSNFPQGTLIHMDIKPANIIYNQQTKKITLIDYECSRFCDIDYGRIQIFITGYKNYNKDYTNHILPIISNGLTLETIIANDKLLCYLFYQVICNLMFYEERKITCHKTMLELYKKLLIILTTKEII